MKALPLALALPCGLLLGSCRDQAPSVENESPPAPKHAWDWVPEDPALAAGREIYLAECALCHNEGEEGAPTLGRSDKWEKRISRGEDELIRRAIEGFIGSDGEMPARGGSDYLTDRQVAQAVRFIIAAPRE